MRPRSLSRLLSAAALIIALGLALACSEAPSEGKAPAQFSPEQIRDQRESLDALESEVDELARSASELQVLAAQIGTLNEDVQTLQRALAQHRVRLEKMMAATESSARPDWASYILIAILTITVAIIIYFGVRLFRGYEEADLPPEAYTPGMSAKVDPEPRDTPEGPKASD
jgi:hypothetical protein